MNLFIFSNNDFLVESNNENFEIKTMKEKRLALTSSEMFFKVYPLNNQNLTLPYYFKIFGQNGNIFSTSNLANIYKLNDDNFLLILKENYISKITSSDNHNNTSKNISINQKENFEIEIENKVVYHTTEQILDCNFEQKFNLIFCTLKKEFNSDLLIIDNENKIVYQDQITVLEFTENGFQTLNDFQDLHGQGKVKKFDIVDNVISLNKEYPVYMDNNFKKLSDESLKPLAFFDCVKAGNLKLAKTYLTSELSNKVSTAHFEAYFGNFDKAYLLKTLYDFPAIVLTNSKTNEIKKYKLTYINNLIDNIESIN